jgi:cytochrome c peroxidase
MCAKPGGTHADPDLVHAAAVDDATEQTMLAATKRQMPAPGAQSIITLGKLEMFDKSLSFNGTVACVTCHAPGVGFREGSSLLNATMVAHPGAVAIPAMHGDHPNNRLGSRYTMSYGYAPFRPVLHYDDQRKDFVGGNFWDLRATGQQTGNPVADQAKDRRSIRSRWRTAIPRASCTSSRSVRTVPSSSVSGLVTNTD